LPVRKDLSPGSIQYGPRDNTQKFVSCPLLVSGFSMTIKAVASLVCWPNHPSSPKRSGIFCWIDPEGEYCEQEFKVIPPTFTPVKASFSAVILGRAAYKLHFGKPKEALTAA